MVENLPAVWGAAAAAAAAKSLQSCPTLSDPMDCSLPGFSVHGILQARVLEWGAIAVWGTWVQFVGQEDSPREGKGNPFRYSYLENPMDGEAW